jgi:branched-chain amino acid transport system substrate-binding protein
MALHHLTRRYAIALALGSAIGVPSVHAQGTGPIKLGLLLTYAGPTASFAREQDRGAQLLIEQVNQAGGIHGRQVELVQYNTEGKPDRASSLYRRLADEDKVVGVIGPDSIFVTLGMANVPTETKTMSVAGPGLYELVQPNLRGYIVSAWAAHSVSGALVLGHLKDKFKVTRVGMITTADAVGERMARNVKAIAALFGVDVVAVEAQPASDRDLLPSLRKLASRTPAIEALYVFGSGPFANIAMNQAELAGIRVPIAYNGGNVLPELVKEISPATAARVFVTTARASVAKTLPKDDPHSQVVQKFYNDFKTKYKQDSTLPSAVGYDMALTLVDAIRNVGPDREKVRDFIRTKQRFVGAQGIEFARTPADGYGTNPADLVVAGIKDGEFIFAGYVKATLDANKVSPARLRAAMAELGLFTE